MLDMIRNRTTCGVNASALEGWPEQQQRETGQSIESCRKSEESRREDEDEGRGTRIRVDGVDGVQESVSENGGEGRDCL
tara:strand:+ start:66 stop:302 length:237 start_codon:yes stop_codon:yes gene_type:complete